jgi:hypothetical protein
MTTKPTESTEKDVAMKSSTTKRSKLGKIGVKKSIMRKGKVQLGRLDPNPKPKKGKHRRFLKLKGS